MTETYKQEDLELRYDIFMQTVEVLSQNADKQCQLMDYYNVAWELVNDADIDGNEILIQGAQKLPRDLLVEIQMFLKALKRVSSEVFICVRDQEDSVNTMKHSDWNVIRKSARSLFKNLKKNRGDIEKN